MTQWVDVNDGIDANIDQPGLAEDFQVVGDRRLSETEGLKLADAGLAAARKSIDDREACRIGERLEAGREILELLGPKRRCSWGATGDARELLH